MWCFIGTSNKEVQISIFLDKTLYRIHYIALLLFPLTIIEYKLFQWTRYIRKNIFLWMNDQLPHLSTELSKYKYVLIPRPCWTQFLPSASSSSSQSCQIFLCNNVKYFCPGPVGHKSFPRLPAARDNRVKRLECSPRLPCLQWNMLLAVLPQVSQVCIKGMHRTLQVLVLSFHE